VSATISKRNVIAFAQIPETDLDAPKEEGRRLYHPNRRHLRVKGVLKIIKFI
jgi:hypothetical protein